MSSMKEAITYSNIKVNCKIEIDILHNLQIKIESGQHIVCEITGIVREDRIDGAIETGSRGDAIQVCISNDDAENPKILFDGMIKNVNIEYKTGIAYIHIYGISNTFKMDIEKRRRSFQDTTKSYKNIFEEILWKYKYVDNEWYANDKCLEYPLIQYEETDWEFINRICSHINAIILLCYKNNNLCICVGIQNGKEYKQIEGEHIQLKLKKEEYVKFLKSEETSKKNYTYVILEGYKDYSLGDKVNYKGNKMIVYSKTAEMKNGYLLFIYKLAFPKYFESMCIYNLNLKGIMLKGVVKKTMKEKVQVLLDIDQEWHGQNLYFYDWIPITGNAFYCMPEQGENVVLYMPSNDERDAFVNYAIRGNEKKSDEMNCIENRMYTSKDNKKLYMYPQIIGLKTFEGQKESAKCILEDGTGISMESVKGIKIISKRQFYLKAKYINIFAQREATLVKKDILNSTVLNICNAFDFVGKGGGFKSIQEDSIINNKVKAVKWEIEEYNLGKVTAHLVNSIPMDDDDDDLIARAIGSVPVLCMNRRIYNE